MADIQKTIEVVFGVVDKSGGRIQDFADKFDSLNGSVQGLTDPLATTTDSLLKAEAAVLAVAAAAGGFAAKEAAAFEAGLADVSKTTDITGDSLESLGARVQELSVETGLGTQRLNEIATAAGQLGVTGEENILAFTETIAKLGESSDVAGERAAQSLARILNVTGESTARVSDLGNALVALGNNVAATESEILRAANETARATAQFGLASEEVTAIGGALAATGARAEGAGTAIGRTFREIQSAINGGGESMERLQEITGLTGQRLRTTFEENALEVFTAFIQGIGDAEQSTAQVFDEFNLATEEVLKTISPLVENTEQFTRAIEIANRGVEEGTALEDEFAKRLETTEQQAKRTAAAFRVAAQRVGAEFAPATGEALAAATELFDTLGDAAGGDNALGDLLDFLSRQLNEVTDQLLGMADALPEALESADFSGFTDSLLDLKDATSGLFGDLDLTKPEDLADALTTVSDVIGGLTQVTTGIVEALTPFLQGLAGAAEGASELDAETQQLIGNVLGAAKAVNTISGALSGVSGMLLGAGGIISALGQAGLAAAALQGKFSTGSQAATGLTGSLGSVVTKAGAARVALTSLRGLGIASVFTATAAAVAEAAQQFQSWQEAADVAADAQGRAQDKVAVLRDLTHDLGITTENLSSKAAEYSDKLQQALDPAQEMAGISDELRNRLREAFGLRPVEDFGQEVERTKGKTEELGESAQDANNKAGDSAKDGAEAQGLFSDKAQETINQLENGVVPAARSAGDAGRQAGRDAATGMEEATEEASQTQQRMAELASQFQDRVISATVDLNTSRLDAQTQRTESVLDGLSDSFQNTGENIGSLFEEITSNRLSAANRLEALDQIRTENSLRERSFDLQSRFAEQVLATNRAASQQSVSFNEVARQVQAITERYSSGAVPAVEASGRALETVAQQTQEAASGANKGLDTTQAKTEEVQGALTELSAEVYTAKVELRTAQAQAQAQQFTATMEALSGTVDSTGSLLANLFEEFSDANTWQQRQRIEEAIDKEQKRREEALELQNELTEKQKEYLDARTERLQQGESEITINAEGLEPELEAFMWKIVERLHVRASEQEAEFLIGLNL